MFAKRLSSRRRAGQFTMRAARHVPRADHDVGVAGGSDERGQLPRIVREVGVHLADSVAPARRSPRWMPSMYDRPRPRRPVRCMHLDAPGVLRRRGRRPARPFRRASRRRRPGRERPGCASGRRRAPAGSRARCRSARSTSAVTHLRPSKRSDAICSRPADQDDDDAQPDEERDRTRRR